MKRRAARVLGPLLGVLGMVGLAPVPVASAASVTPTLTLSQGATQAGSTQSVGQDDRFAYSNPGDSVKDLTLTLPPGLLADAAIDNGHCLQTTTLSSPCQVASGTVNATATVVLLPLTIGVPVSLYLVPPPSPSDLAGIQIVANDPPLITGPLGPPADVVVHAPDAHVTITFSNVPNSAQVLLGVTVPISVQEIQTTLTGMRLPTKCSALPPLGLSVTTYDAASAAVSRPLTVTGCSNLALIPAFTATAAKDATDNGAEVTTDLRQSQPTGPRFPATARTVVLTLPPSVLGPNVLGALNVICGRAAPYAGCTPIGSATATSPLYPAALTGKAYLVGSLAAPGIAIIFPPPLSLSLVGSVNIATGSTTFTDVPDLPLSDLEVLLFGGPNAVFSASCDPSSGTASATLTSQTGDQTATSQAPLTVAGCPSARSGTGPGGTPGGGHVPRARQGRPSVKSVSISHLGSGLPILRFRVLKGSNAPPVRSVAIELPAGLTFRHGRVHGRALIRVHVVGARVTSDRLLRGRLLIALRSVRSAFTIQVQGIREAAALKRKARQHRLRKLTMGVGITDASGQGTVLRVVVHALRL